MLVNQLELTYNSSAWTQDAVWKTCQDQWLIGTDEEKESRKSMLVAQLDEDVSLALGLKLLVLHRTVCKKTKHKQTLRNQLYKKIKYECTMK